MDNPQTKTYVLYVNPGNDPRTAKMLKKFYPDYDFYVPQEIVIQKYGEKRYQSLRTIFQGLIFVDLKEHQTAENLAADLHRLQKELQRWYLLEDTPFPVADEEMAVLNRLLSPEHVVGISTMMKFGKMPHFIDGPLVGMEERVKKVDFHKSRAYLTISILGGEQKISVSADLVDESGKPVHGELEPLGVDIIRYTYDPADYAPGEAVAYVKLKYQYSQKIGSEYLRLSVSMPSFDMAGLKDAKPYAGLLKESGPLDEEVLDAWEEVTDINNGDETHEAEGIEDAVGAADAENAEETVEVEKKGTDERAGGRSWYYVDVMREPVPNPDEIVRCELMKLDKLMTVPFHYFATDDGQGNIVYYSVGCMDYGTHRILVPNDYGGCDLKEIEGIRLKAPVAVYSVKENKLYFQKMLAAIRVFKWMTVWYRNEMRQVIVRLFEDSPFKLDMDFRRIGRGNIQKLVADTETLRNFTPGQRKKFLDYLREYEPRIPIQDGEVLIQSDKNLRHVLYAVEDRYFTGAATGKKMIAIHTKPVE